MKNDLYLLSDQRAKSQTKLTLQVNRSISFQFFIEDQFRLISVIADSLVLTSLFLAKLAVNVFIVTDTIRVSTHATLA